MAGAIKRLLSKWKYGKPIIIVSGLPRSGTSMMMKMLEAVGLEPVTDGIRTADKDNPKGYYELERVKTLDKPGDKSWVAEHKGKVIKVISFLLKDLPSNVNYKVIFMRRSLAEVLVSQNKMLEHRGESNPVEDEKMHRNFEMHLRKVDYQLKTEPNMEVLYVDYKNALENPHFEAKRIAEFLGGGVSAEKMAEVADPNLYRNRK